MITIENFISGKFCKGKSFIDSFDPSTGEVHAKVPCSGHEDVELAVKAAEDALNRYCKQIPKKTIELLFRYLEKIQKSVLEVEA